MTSKKGGGNIETAVNGIIYLVKEQFSDQKEIDLVKIIIELVKNSIDKKDND